MKYHVSPVMHFVIAFSLLTVLPAAAEPGSAKKTAKPVSAPTSSTSDAKASLSDQFKKLQGDVITIKSLKVDYSHTRSRKIRGKNFTTKGFALFLSPNKFRWVKKNSEILFDGKQIFQYNPAEKSAVKFNIGNDEGRQINRLMSVVLNFNALEESYSITKLSDVKNVTTVVLSPKDKKDPVEFVRLKIDRLAKVLVGIYIQMPDSFSEYVFSNHDTSPLPSTAFNLPADTKVSSL